MPRLAAVAALLAALAAAALAGAAAPPAHASKNLVTGIYDETQTLYGNPDKTFPVLEQLGTQAIRVNLYWGGRYGASLKRPKDYKDPNEEGAYDWGIYDRAVRYAAQYGIDVVFSIVQTPAWANKRRGIRQPPTSYADLQKFAYTAALRYSGATADASGSVLPKVKYWLAWNEPNNPVFLRPQFKRVGKKWVAWSPRVYAKICNAVVKGVHSTISGQKVACGVTAPRGNNQPRSSRASISPIAFLIGMRRGGARGFDAYAHHPYYGKPSEKPNAPPPPTRKGGRPTAITLGNINTLIKAVTARWGRKPIWITEYGYQTRPPDRLFGVTPKLQARYLTQAFAIARKNPRVQMMLWFLLRDDRRVAGWQSGLFYASGKKKPAYEAFRKLNPKRDTTRRR